jgi:cardiolipin synthase
MGHYRARDLLLVPSLLSLSRLPLAFAFSRCLDYPFLALGVLALAGLTDILDGYYARKLGQATPTGAVVDGVTDKLFVGSVVLALVAKGAFTWPEAFVLALRELVELPIVLWWALHLKQRKARAEDPRRTASGRSPRCSRSPPSPPRSSRARSACRSCSSPERQGSSPPSPTSCASFAPSREPQRFAM